MPFNVPSQPYPSAVNWDFYDPPAAFQQPDPGVGVDWERIEAQQFDPARAWAAGTLGMLGERGAFAPRFERAAARHYLPTLGQFSLAGVGAGVGGPPGAVFGERAPEFAEFAFNPRWGNMGRSVDEGLYGPMHGWRDLARASTAHIGGTRFADYSPLGAGGGEMPQTAISAQ